MTQTKKRKEKKRTIVTGIHSRVSKYFKIGISNWQSKVAVAS